MDIPSAIRDIILQSSGIMQKIAVFAIVFTAGVIVSVLIRKSITKFLSTKISRALAANIARVVYYTLLLISLIAALGAIGIDLTGLAIAGGFAGIVIGIALQPILSNLFSGIYLMIEKTVNVGEFVEINNNLGEIVNISPMFTRIRTVDGHIVSIANTQIIGSVIKNYSKAIARRVEFNISIAYKENAEKAYNIVKRILDEHPYILVNPFPDVFVSELGQSGVNIKVRVWTPPQVAYDVVKDLLWRIKKALSEEGIEIPFTQVDIWFRTPLIIDRQYTD
ncbi:MAG: mechanosensitive ion channel family protein [Ignisphaera sp.]|uniref:Mechanosensitive ion channel family protein n=1 Tax=Ignisphaera aggregans TaxID=334771 RepID=A0A7C4NTK4_9CREN